MNESNDWGSLQEIWRDDKLVPSLDVEAMIRSARRQRNVAIMLLVGEWILTGVALSILVLNWAELAATPLDMLWWSFFLAIMLIVLAITTWTRIGSLREPAGASLKDWLGLRRHRARLGLRLARLTRVCVAVLLPALVIFMLAGGAKETGLRAVFAFGAPVLLLAGGWIWGGRQARRMQAELAEVEQLEAEWLEEKGADQR